MKLDQSLTNGDVRRRPPGQARRLLLNTARDLFSRRDYRSTTTREIAELAGVSEYLLFRHFGSKAALFREALVVPFVDFVDDFASRWTSFVPDGSTEEDIGRLEDEIAHQFIGALYDLFVEHRGLIVTLWASDGMAEQELQDIGIPAIDRALAVLGRLGAEGIHIGKLQAKEPAFAAHSTVAMVAGMAAFGAPFFGGRRPPRQAIVEELTQATLHGFLHRPK